MRVRGVYERVGADEESRHQPWSHKVIQRAFSANTFAMRAGALSANVPAVAQLPLLHAHTCVASREERQERGDTV